MYHEVLTEEEVRKIHETSMRVLETVGVEIPVDEAQQVFRDHGFRVENGRVHPTEAQVMSALAGVPKRFVLHARNPERSVEIGGGSAVTAPGYGAPFLVDRELGKRSPTLEDYSNLAKLAHALPNQDVSGHLIVEPEGVDQAHLHMLHAHLIHSDKPFMGSTAGAEGATQTLEMARIAFGEDLGDRAVTVSLVNSLSPLGYANDMLDVLLVYAKARQPVIIAALAMGGTTAPVSLAGMLAMQTAELLAGLVLTQLVSPGTPVLFGSTSSNVDMRLGSLSIGSPETLDGDRRPRTAGALLWHSLARRRSAYRRQLPRCPGGLRVDAWSEDNHRQRGRLHPALGRHPQLVPRLLLREVRAGR